MSKTLQGHHTKLNETKHIKDRSACAASHLTSDMAGIVVGRKQNRFMSVQFLMAHNTAAQRQFC